MFIMLTESIVLYVKSFQIKYFSYNKNHPNQKFTKKTSENCPFAPDPN